MIGSHVCGYSHIQREKKSILTEIQSKLLFPNMHSMQKYCVIKPTKLFALQLITLPCT